MSEEKQQSHEYNIKGRIFRQKELVLGQLELLVDLLKDIEFQKGFTNLQILKVLGSKMPRAMAIVLLEEGVKIDKIGGEEIQKQIDELSVFFSNNVNISLSLKVIADFFVCTPMENIMQTLASLIPATPTAQAPTV